MAIQPHEEGSILPAEKCLFPIRNDGNLPEKGWQMTKLSSCTLRKAGVLRSCSCSSCENQTNGLEQKEPLYFLAAVWALLLWEFAEVDTVQIGVHDIVSPAERVEKQSMRLLAASRRQTKAVNGLLKAEGWSVSNVSENHCPYFNTGIVLYHGQAEKNIPGLYCYGTRMVQGLIASGQQNEQVFLYNSFPNADPLIING